MLKKLWNEGWRWKKNGDSHEFSLEWQDAVLPHDAVIGETREPKQLNGTKKAFFPNGSWEYVKTFEAPVEWKDKCVFLRFEGVQNHALVYLNGNYIGGHANGYTEFTVSLAKYLRFGETNILKVICRTAGDSRWYTGGGIYRDVQLLVAHPFHIEDNGLRIQTLAAGEACARLKISVFLSETRPAALRFTILREGETILESVQPVRAEGDYFLELPSPALWSAETPALYTCRAELLEEGGLRDTAEERFGIRTLSVSAAEGLRVNGKQVRLRGACIHHDSGVLGVRTFREAEYRRVRLLKEAGFNAVRSAHHPADRHLLDACDELGMYVMDELFDQWQQPKSPDDYANDFDANWQKDVEAMTAKDFNHPSVILYSIGNEISDLASSAGIQLAEMIAREVKRQDATRFTTVAINGLLLLMQKMEEAALSGKGHTERKQDINEAMSSLDDVMVRINNTSAMDQIIEGGCRAVDIAGYNYMHNRYEADLEKYPERVIVGSETYAKYIADMWAHIETHNNVIGDFTWTGWDYLGETGIGNPSYHPRDYHEGFYGGYPCITANCGDLDLTGFRLPQSYYREIVFGLRKQPYIAVHDPHHAGEKEYLSTWGWGNVLSSWSFAGFEGTPLIVDVYGRGKVRLYLNGRLVGEGDCGEKYEISFMVPYENGMLEAVIQENGREYRCALRTADGEQRLSLCPEDGAAEGGLLFLHIAVVDGKGIVHPFADRPVTLSVQGGTLLGFGSGAPGTEENFTDNIHSTYRGRALAVIRVEAREVCVRASAEGLEQQILHIAL